jgi:hypothetical protein
MPLEIISIVSNNHIGGKAALKWGCTTVNANTNHSFKAIYLNIGTTTVSSIQNNAIRNFSYNTAPLESY